MKISCECGAVELDIAGAPIAQLYCHCDDCQAVHGRAYQSAVFPANAVKVVRGELEAKTLKTTPRMKCQRCGSFMFAEVASFGIRGVNASLFPHGEFRPQFHVQCQFAVDQIQDGLPHFKNLPSQFGGSGELMPW